MREEDPDVLCLQETKCAEKSLPADITSMPEYPHKYWLGSDDKEGYSGVAMLCKTEPIKVTYGIGECCHLIKTHPLRSYLSVQEAANHHWLLPVVFLVVRNN